jgi:copper homeostasis protein (lipoprotein)
MTYLERSAAPLDDVGSWALSSDRRILVLQGRGPQPELFAASSPGVLRKLALDGQPIDSRLPYDLTRASAFRPLDVRVPLHGLYSYLADAAMFVDCSTGQRWPVAAEAAGADLERAYLAARPVPGSAVLVELEGLVAQRPGPEGGGTGPTLVVEKVGQLRPRDSCAARFTSAPLNDTYWRLTRLGDTDVPPAADPRRELSLTFQAPIDGMPGAYAGSTGCNRAIGTYALDNAALLLTGGGTLTACKDQAAAEAAFIAALKATRTYRITGRTLDLMDGDGRRLARFEARTAAGITRSELRR